MTAHSTPDLKAVKALWQRLEAEPAMSFHQSRAWVDSWTKGTSTPLAVVTLEQDGVAYALLPLEIKRIGGLRIAQFAGTAFSNENTGLIDLGVLEGVAAASPADLAAALSQAGLDADIVLFDKMTPEAAARPPFSALPRVYHQNPSFQLPLGTDFNAVLAQVNGKRRRKKFRVSERRLEAIGGYRHITGEDDAQALRLLDIFLAQKPARLASQGLPNVFAGREIRAFLAELATTRNAAGCPALELHGIELTGGDHAGAIIAVAALTIKDRHVTCQFGSIDENIAGDASAGELLFYRMIERASAAGHEVFDFGVGDQPYKRSWCPQRTELVDCYAPLNLKGRLAAPLISGMIRLKRAIKTSPTLHRSVAWLRGLMVRKPVAPERD
ncbi:MAG: GNAT family N-acetyltransferase [Hoeflea sp.]|uniref:GNAT family N-acetyltransferase n=1 Tax=Hoeflea sp. TaxID=1940281 RepID=UPI001D1CBAEA|nr:GNAT family N-acetyltransferase [Hoeflea sp.]MBU4530258.1 GNAT family N-acetyltransferase [Alphaproteobacteria bacterium]MBU4542482.1 GNAT family N-acetyltransferase [Alphaproteobacteria bacterium]MBU4551168.1 GNAT family N-acetyltransferase [Alphaproteobacteria bacterium]MBV1723304.1 GNAT family N-acetyltransferase [Hoeflea sp.]MBV1760274.1 GNAT family N-acetyltransferase [Hoeflea sp.]